MLTSSWGDALSDADEVLFALTLYQTASINGMRRLSSSTRHLTEVTSRGMQHHMVQEATPRPLKHSIRCSQNWTSLPRNIFKVIDLHRITLDHHVLIDINDSIA